MRILPGAIAGLLVLLAAGPVAADSGVLTMNAGQETDVVTLTLRAGDVVEYQWSSGFPVGFRIERQGAGDAFNTTSQATTGTFTAPSDGTYVFSFHSEGSFNVVSWNINKRVDYTLFVAIGALAAVGVVGAILAVAMRARKRRTAGPAAPAPPPPPTQ